MPSGPKVAGTLLFLSPDTEDREVGGGSTHNWPFLPLCFEPCEACGLVCVHVRVCACMLVFLCVCDLLCEFPSLGLFVQD